MCEGVWEEGRGEDPCALDGGVLGTLGCVIGGLDFALFKPDLGLRGCFDRRGSRAGVSWAGVPGHCCARRRGWPFILIGGGGEPSEKGRDVSWDS